MRSGLIFAISQKVSNPYMLCRMVAASARKMHRDGVSISQSINRSLQVLQQGRPSIETGQSSPVVAPDQKQPEVEAGVLVP